MPPRRLSARAIGRRSLQRRLTELESQGGINAEPMEPMAVVFVEPNGEFGGQQCYSDRASEWGSGRIWDRKHEESQEDFAKRVMDDVPKPTGLNCSVVIFWPVERGGP